MMWALISVAVLVAQTACIFYAIRHFCKARDAEWRMWAQDHGIDDGYPGYGYTRKDAQ